MKEFKYDVVQLIQAVKEHPCLWDKTEEVYKDRYERRKAWEEIFSILDDTYESMSSEEKRLTGEHVLSKWTNVRDTFVKSLRPKMGKPRRKYCLHNYLEFLCSTIEQDETTIREYNSMKEEPDQTSDDDIIVINKKSKRDRSNDSTYEPNTSRNDSSRSKRSKKKSSFDSMRKEDLGANDNIDFVELEDMNATADHNRLMNEDEAFFASLLPTVVKYGEDERLEFRIEVLNLMKKIKDNRNWSSADG